MIKQSRCFTFTNYTLSESLREIVFNYSHTYEDGSIEDFSEKLVFKETLSPAITKRKDVVQALTSLHLMLGISYFKMYVPRLIEHPYIMSKEQAEFWNVLYTSGLGEFYYVNNLDFRGLVNFSHSENANNFDPTLRNIDSKALILHGGGKDSILSVEIVKEMGNDFDLFSFGTSDIQKNVAEVVEKEVHMVNRVLDPKLLERDKTGEVYKGHVPISAIYAHVAALYALLFGYTHIISSNEHSSNYGSIDYLDMHINHQWSKSVHFEKLFQQYTLTYIASDLTYFSLLRPLFEIYIVKLFTLYPKYFEVFSSSNSNFILTSNGSKPRWDSTYSKGKVEFVYALFSAFLSSEDMMRIFEKNIYDDPESLPKYKQLLGKEEIKPLDCVGTPEEVIVALYLAYKQGYYEQTHVMKYFVTEVLPKIKNIEDHIEKVFSYGDDSLIPEEYKMGLKNILNKVDVSDFSKKTQ